MATIRREVSNKKTSSKPKATESTSGFLGNITSSSEDNERGLSLIIYGKEGVGKTSLAAYAPAPIFVIDKQEQGIRRLKSQGLIPDSVEIGPDIESWDDALSALDELRDGDHAFETVVIDSLTGFQRLCFEACCQADWNGDMTKEGFFAFGNGPKTAAQNYWPDLLDRLNDLLAQRINVILLGHSVVKPYNNPEGFDYDRFMCDLDKAIWAVTARWAGAVLYYKHNIDISKDGRKMKASGGESRLLCCEYDAAYDAKNSYGLPPVLDPFYTAEEVWNNLYERLSNNPTKKESPPKKRGK